MKKNTQNSHQSQRAYLHPGSYTAGSLLRNGEAWDNRAYLKYELVLCHTAAPAGEPEGNDKVPIHAEVVPDSTQHANEVAIETDPDIAAIRELVRPKTWSVRPTAPASKPEELKSEKKPTYERADDMFADMATEMGSDSGADIRASEEALEAPNNLSGKTEITTPHTTVADRVGLLFMHLRGREVVAGEDGGDAPSSAIDDYKLAGGLYETYCNKDNTRRSLRAAADTSSAEGLAEGEEKIALLAAGATRVDFSTAELDEVINSMRMEGSEREPLSERSKKLKAKLLEEGLLSLVRDGQKSPDHACSALFGISLGKLIGTDPIEISFADADIHYMEPVAKAQEEAADQERIRSQLPLAICKGLVAAGKGGEKELLLPLLEAIVDCAFLAENGGNLEDALDNPTKQALFTPFNETNNDARATYLQSRNWPEFFRNLFSELGDQTQIPISPTGRKALAIRLNGKLRNDLFNELKGAFDTIGQTKEIEAIYALLPPTAAGKIYEKERAWNKTLETRKARAKEDRSLIVTRKNVPIYYMLHPHIQEIFQLFLTPEEQDKFLSLNVIKLGDDEVEGEIRNLEELLLERFREFAKVQLLKAGGFADLSKDQKTKLALHFIRTVPDIKTFFDEAGISDGSREKGRILAQLKEQNAGMMAAYETSGDN